MVKVRLNDKVIYLTDESYNSNPLSLKFAVENFNKENQSNKYLILGDMLELGKFSKKLHINLSKNINSSSIDKFHVYGRFVNETYKNIKNIKKGNIISKQYDINDLIVKELNNNDYLMIKGSNSTGLNKFVTKLKNNKSYAL